MYRCACRVLRVKASLMTVHVVYWGKLVPGEGSPRYHTIHAYFNLLMGFGRLVTATHLPCMTN